MIPETENSQEAKSVYPVRLIRVDTLRRVQNVGFLAGRLVSSFIVVINGVQTVDSKADSAKAYLCSISLSHFQFLYFIRNISQI